MIDDTREEYLRGAGTEADAARGGGVSTDRGGRDAGMPGPSGEAADRAADSGGEGRASPDASEPDGGGSGRKAVDNATATVTDPGPTS